MEPKQGRKIPKVNTTIDFEYNTEMFSCLWQTLCLGFQDKVEDLTEKLKQVLPAEDRQNHNDFFQVAVSYYPVILIHPLKLYLWLNFHYLH